ncbi:hypothetical protein ACWEVD_01460 [Nocardia thailandica]
MRLILWHQHYATLCTDPGSATRKLLGPATIEVPASFTGDDLAAMRAAAADDPRLQMAVDKADDGQITQYLAGGPELVDFYERRASKIGKAVITAAMDLVRLGHANAIPLTLLREASTAYIDDTTWATRPTNWFETPRRSGRRVLGPIRRSLPTSGWGLVGVAAIVASGVRRFRGSLHLHVPRRQVLFSLPIHSPRL